MGIARPMRLRMEKEGARGRTGGLTIGKIRDEFPERIRMQGNFSWYFAHHLALILKLYLHIRQKYGNPDCQILATLKNKIQIHGFLSFLSNNMRSDFIFRVAICF